MVNDTRDMSLPDFVRGLMCLGKTVDSCHSIAYDSDFDDEIRRVSMTIQHLFV